MADAREMEKLYAYKKRDIPLTVHQRAVEYRAMKLKRGFKYWGLLAHETFEDTTGRY